MKRVTAAAVALAALAGPVGAQEKAREDGVSWAAGWDEAVAEASIRNVPIVFHYHGDGNPVFEQCAEETRKPAYIKASRECVNVIACKNTHGEETATVDGKQVKVCRRYGHIPCEAHVKCANGISSFTDEKNHTIPLVWIVSPGGSKILKEKKSSGTVIPGTDIMKDALTAMRSLPGEHVGWVEWQLLQKAREDWREGWEKGEWKRAMKGAQAMRTCKSSILVLEGRAAMNKLSDKGYELIDEARRQLSSEPEKAKQTLRLVADAFKPLSSSRTAQEILDSLK